MSSFKKFDNVTKAQIAANGVQALSDRPNSTGSYGVGGLSPADLKKWFDRLAELLAERINTIHNALSSDDAAKYIRVALDDSGVDSLSALIEGFLSGAFSAKILKVYPTVSASELVTLQQAIYELVTRAELKELVNELETTLEQGNATLEASNKLFRELEERLKADDVGDEALKRHNENLSAHEKILGAENKKGLKGYWIEAVVPESNMLRLSTKNDRSSVGAPTISTSITGDGVTSTGYAVGDEFSIITPVNHHILCGKITAIQNNLITYALYPEADEINWNAGNPIDNNDYSFVVPEKYDVGIITVSEGGVPTGHNNVAGGCDSLVGGYDNKVIGDYGFTSGQGNIAGYGARGNGRNTKAIGMDSATDGYGTKAKGSAAYAGGVESEADGYGAFATNIKAKARGKGAFATGNNTEADGEFAFSAGGNTKSKGKYGATFGESSEIAEYASTGFAAGFLAKVLNSFAQAFGWRTEASGTASASFGSESRAKGSYSFAANKGTIANGEAQTALGKFNKENPNAYLIVGNGTSDTDRSNALEVLKDGTIVTPYGPVTHMVTGSYVGTGARVTLAFDTLPDVLFVTSPSVRLYFPKVGRGIYWNISEGYSIASCDTTNNTVTLYTESSNLNTLYKYIALYSAIPNSKDVELVSFNIITAQVHDGSGAIIETDNTESFVKAKGTTWSEFISDYKAYRTKLNYQFPNWGFIYGIGATTGRVYWYYGFSTDNSYRLAKYLKDSKGNYVLGTDVIKDGEYTCTYGINDKYLAAPSDIAPLD